MAYDFEESRVDATGRRLAVRRLDIEELLARLLWFVRVRMAAGDWSVRGLAVQLGCSQPHLSNVLVGRRVLTPDLADAMLWHFRLELLDFVGPSEYSAWLDRAAGNSLNPRTDAITAAV